jgi:hypothetical protein
MGALLGPSVAAASVIATVSAASQRDITDLLGVGAERIALLPAAAHPSCGRAAPEVVADVRARHGLHRPYVLTVGTLEPRKNLPTLLRAFDQLGSEAAGHELVVVGGRGWLDRRLVHALETRRGARRVRWLGYVTESDLVALYTGADLLVLASTWEGFGLPVIEAMACGTPVIASDVAALREVGGDAARFVPPGDDRALARAIAESLRGDGVASNGAPASAAGLQRARQFSWTRTAETLWARAHTTGPSRLRGPRSTALPEQAPIRLPDPLLPVPAGLDPRSWALLATVVYADLFDSPLPWKQALSATIGVEFDEPELRRLAVSPALSHLVTVHPAGFLVLTGRETLVDAIPERERLTRTLLDRNRSTLSLLAALPFVRSLVISGGLAHRNPGARPDVDLFVVAAAGRAYSAYSMIFLATKLTEKRQLICPNYVVDEHELAVVYHRDLFTAHQLVSSRPVSGVSSFAALCRANSAWVRRFFPAFADSPPRTSEPTKDTELRALQRLGELVLRPIGPALESLLRSAWRVRLRRRASGAPRADVVLSDGIMKLHLSDYRRRVMDRFDARLQALRAKLEDGSSRNRAGLEPVGT